LWRQAWLFLFVFGATVPAITLHFLKHDPALVPVALMILAMAVRLLDEERFLVANLAGHAEYRQKV